ncbi:MAG: 3-hydroxyacyl-CoA dehydrogenase NAD-binding domain-containing protein [Pirellulales bacterium]
MPIVSLDWPEPDIATLTFDDPSKGANVLSRSVLNELAAHLDVLEKRADLAGVIVRSGKPGTFIAGADLREFAKDLDAAPDEVIELCTHGRKLFERLSKLPGVSVAAIDGICVGGGAELAVWCDRRVFSDNPKTAFGFPEVKLGLMPGWGGTARSTRLVGLGNAVELVTGGENIDPHAAQALGLAIDVVPAEKLLAAAVNVIRQDKLTSQYLTDRRHAHQGVNLSETELTFLGATAAAYIQGQTKGHYPAPLAALELMLSAARLDLETACQREAEAFVQLFGTPVNRALLNVFFLSDRNKKDTGVERPVEPRPVKSVSVLGAGIMGQGIAVACIKRGLPVNMSDAAAEALAGASQSVLTEAAYNKALKGPDVQKMPGLAALFNATTSDEELARVDLLIEAIVENMEVKRSVYKRLEPKLRDDAILASNTSTIPIGKLAEGLARPERFCGIHFFNPVRKMPLVEVIRGAKTSDETVATAVAFAKKIGKSPIVVNDGPGFLVNRLLFPYMQESLELLVEGVPVKLVERAAKDFGMPMGPITLYDVVGLDTAFYAGRVMWEAFPDRIIPSQLLATLVKRGRLGQKAGAGFFAYPPGKKPEKGVPDPAFEPILQTYLRGDPLKLTQEQVTARLFLPMLLEATRALEDGVVRDPRDVDLGLIYGLGFPPFKGGLLFWADTLGAAKILEMLGPFEALGPRMQPTQLLLDMARDGRKFCA